MSRRCAVRARADDAGMRKNEFGAQTSSDFSHCVSKPSPQQGFSFCPPKLWITLLKTPRKSATKPVRARLGTPLSKKYADNLLIFFNILYSRPYCTRTCGAMRNTGPVFVHNSSRRHPWRAVVKGLTGQHRWRTKTLTAVMLDNSIHSKHRNIELDRPDAPDRGARPIRAAFLKTERSRTWPA